MAATSNSSEWRSNNVWAGSAMPMALPCSAFTGSSADCVLLGLATFYPSSGGGGVTPDNTRHADVSWHSDHERARFPSPARAGRRCAAAP